MKKTLSIPISILAVLAVTFASLGQNASSMETIGGQRWWTVDELYVKVEEMKELARGECGDDIKCKKSYYKQLILDKEMATANVFAGYDILISSVSPAEQKMQMLFLGRTRLQYRNSDEQQNYISKLYVGWLDEENWETVGGDYDSLLASFQDKSGESKMHFLYEGSLEEGNVPMPDETVDIFIDDDFDKIGRIYYIIECTDGPGSGSWGSFKFADYGGNKFETGKEYKIKIGEYSGFGLFETKDEAIADDGGIENDEEAVGSEEGGLGADELDGEGLDSDAEREENNGENAVVERILAPDTGIVKKS